MRKNTSVPKPLILSGIRDNHTRGRAALLAVPISGNHSEIHPTLGNRSNGNARTWARCPAAEAITMGISGDTRIKSVEPIRSIVEQCPLLGI